MGAKRLCQGLAVLCCVLAGALFLEARLDRAILPWEEPDPTTGTAALYILFLGLGVWFAGDFAALRQRVERLERRLREGEAVHAAGDKNGLAPSPHAEELTMFTANGPAKRHSSPWRLVLDIVLALVAIGFLIAWLVDHE